jgi:5-oxopent-3-ene-1,2,5-tricarboxylate decarboxylase / 2-hydroxyhepta-2,4-diene-1,7-dioate isomerase
MKHARVAYAGAIHAATESNGCVRLRSGRILSEEDVVWLPPLLPGTNYPGTIFALGLNYADHAKELDFKAPSEPLIFMKGPQSLCGHRGYTIRPPGVSYMHYECELAVVIGKTARGVSKTSAYDYVAGYTVANDYTIRDYLENFYRPNFRVKSRDHSTPLGPWLVDAADVLDPMNLELRTRVNGQVTQQGSTRDMIFDIPTLIAYLTGFMTLAPGDIILTGTPQGLAGVHAGDEVITEIDGIGSLKNTIIEDSEAPSHVG